MNFRYGSKTISVDIDVEDIIEQIDTEALIEEIQERNTKDIDLSSLGIPDTDNLRSLIQWWLREHKMPNIWSFSDDELTKLIIKEVSRK